MATKVEFDIRMKAAECAIKAYQAKIDGKRCKADFYERAEQHLKEGASYIERAENCID